jgi:hypothetical protein
MVHILHYNVIILSKNALRLLVVIHLRVNLHPLRSSLRLKLSDLLIGHYIILVKSRNLKRDPSVALLNVLLCGNEVTQCLQFADTEYLKVVFLESNICYF